MNRDLWPTPPTEEQMRSMLRTMTTIRLFEQEVLKGGEAVALHSSAGHEAVASGICESLRSDDLMVLNHRPWAHFLAKNKTEPNILGQSFAELMGREGGVCHGIGGEMHLSMGGVVMSSMIIGACLSVACGVGLSLKKSRVEWDGSSFVPVDGPADQVVVVNHGDATSTNGQWGEALSLARTLRLPVMFLMENNGLDANSPSELYMPTPLATHRAMGYGIETNVCDGTDALAVFEAGSKAIEYVRRRREPFFLEALCVREGRHKVPRMRDERPENVRQQARMRGPIQKLRCALISEGLWSEAQDQDMRGEIEKEIREAVEFAKASPLNPRSPQAIQAAMLEERAKGSPLAVRP